LAPSGLIPLSASPRNKGLRQAPLLSLPQLVNEALAMSNTQADLHVHENRLGHLEMAGSLASSHFQHLGRKCMAGAVLPARGPSSATKNRRTLSAVAKFTREFDSLAEGEGFELPVPIARASLDSRGGEGAGGQSDGLERRRPFSRGTSGSNPSSFTGESVSPAPFLSAGALLHGSVVWRRGVEGIGGWARS
jgi:hypothetical protein